MILDGRVRVNGQVVTELGRRVSPEVDLIEVDGRVLESREHFVYYVLHKPIGVVTTVRDPQGRPTVIELVPVRERIYPVGRLDQDTTGVLLLTNDGDLAYRLTHPRYGVQKRYRALVRGVVSEGTLQDLARGVFLEDGVTAPAKVQRMRQEENRTELELTIHEGRNRQVRRMLGVVGHPVISLRRLAFGPIGLGSLLPGQYRALSTQEVKQLQQAAGLTGAPKRTEVRQEES